MLARCAVLGANLRFLRAAMEPLPSTERALLLPSTTVAHFPSAYRAPEGEVLLEVLRGWVPIAVHSRVAI